MTTSLIEADSSWARVLFVGQRLDLKVFEHTEQLADHPLTIRAGSAGIAILFRYGVVVCIGLQPAEQVSFLDDLDQLIREPFESPVSDDVELVFATDQAEGMHQGRVRLQAFDLERLQLVADVLAKSVVLAHYEDRLGEQFDQIEPLAQASSMDGVWGVRESSCWSTSVTYSPSRPRWSVGWR